MDRLYQQDFIREITSLYEIVGLFFVWLYEISYKSETISKY